MRRRVFALVGVGLAVLGLTCGPSIRTVISSRLYPENAPEAPARDRTLAVAASLVPALVVGYERPPEVARCLDALAQDSATPGALWSLGLCLGREQPWERCVEELPWLTCRAAGDAGSPGAEGPRCAPRLACRPSTRDGALLLMALADAGEALYSNQGVTGGAPVVPERLRAPVQRALRNAADVLGADPTRGAATAGARPRSELPVLALRGAGATGAFAAGYLHALLSAREAAMHAARDGGDREASETVERSERFGAAVASGAGSLVAALVDLYFAELGDANRDTRHAGALRRCLWPSGAVRSLELPARALQACALELLQRELATRNEWELLCVEDAPATELVVGSRGAVSALRFEPLQGLLTAGLLGNYEDLMLGNDFVRVSLAAELGQNVGLALDERACGLRGVPSTACLGSAILASLVEPPLSRPVDLVYSGLAREEGERGIWMGDGPHASTARRAVALTAMVDGSNTPLRSRVLAIGTGRGEGEARGGTPAAAQVLLAGYGTMAERGQEEAIAHARLFDDERRRRYGAVLSWLLAPPPRPAPALDASAGDGGGVDAHGMDASRGGARDVVPGRDATGMDAGPERSDAVAERSDGGANTGEGAGDGGVVAPPLGTPTTRFSGPVWPVGLPEEVEPGELLAEGRGFDPVVARGLFLWGQRSFLASHERVLAWLGWRTVARLGGGWLANRRQEVERERNAFVIEHPAAYWRCHRAARRRLVEQCLRACSVRRSRRDLPEACTTPAETCAR